MKKHLVLISMLISAAPVFSGEPGKPELSGDKKYEVKKVNNNAFTYGEQLSYHIHYGVLSGGMAYFEVDDKPQTVNNRNVYYIKVHGKSAGMVDVLFKVRDEYESYLDADALLPWKSTKKVKEGGYTDSDFIIYDHQNGVATSRRGKINIEDQTRDIISAIYYARSTDMTNARPGDEFPVNFYLDGKNYQLRFKFIKREDISTEVGTFRTLVVKPQLIEGRVFKDSEALTLWVSDDENKVPLRAESSLFVGSIRADLVDFKNLKNPLSSKIK